MAWTEPACIHCKKEPGRDKLVPGEACCIQCGHVFDASTGCGREYMADVAEPGSRKLNSTIIFCKACYTTRRSRRHEYAPFNHCVQRDYFEKTCGGIVRK